MTLRDTLYIMSSDLPVKIKTLAEDSYTWCFNNWSAFDCTSPNDLSDSIIDRIGLTGHGTGQKKMIDMLLDKLVLIINLSANCFYIVLD